jgi:hypothetical protein
MPGPLVEGEGLFVGGDEIREAVLTSFFSEETIVDRVLPLHYIRRQPAFDVLLVDRGDPVFVVGSGRDPVFVAKGENSPIDRADKEPFGAAPMDPAVNIELDHRDILGDIVGIVLPIHPEHPIAMEQAPLHRLDIGDIDRRSDRRLRIVVEAIIGIAVTILVLGKPRSPEAEIRIGPELEGRLVDIHVAQGGGRAVEPHSVLIAQQLQLVPQVKIGEHDLVAMGDGL